MNQLEASLNSSSLPKIKINEPVANNLKQQFSKNASSFIQQKVTQAEWLIQAIEQREKTMQKVIKTILRLQKEYFQSGDVQLLKPMILKDIAQIIDMDIATVSRVTSGKYAQTPFGLIHLKDLFSEATQKEDGNWVSNKSIQQVIKEIIAIENAKVPLSDSQITDLLKEKGFPTARRTVAKYREQLGILPAQLRKIL
jgi:RNA polymerase sigma-54 factor